MTWVQTKLNEDGSIFFITLNRTEYANALNTELVEALICAVDTATTSSARLIVFKGNGRNFCGGFDLQNIDSETDGSLAYRFLRLEQLLQKIHYSPIHTLAFAQGAVAGAGADIVAACKKRVAISENTSFRFPGVRFGVLLGTNRLRQLIPQDAYEALLEQDRIDLDNALRCGFIHAQITEAEQDEFIATLYKKISRVPAETSAQILQLDKQQGLIDMGLLANSVADINFRKRVQRYWHDAKSAAKKK